MRGKNCNIEEYFDNWFTKITIIHYISINKSRLRKKTGAVINLHYSESKYGIGLNTVYFGIKVYRSEKLVLTRSAKA